MSLHAVFERRRSARLAPSEARGIVGARPLEGFWTRDLTSSPSATAAAVSALVVAEQHCDDVPQTGPPMASNSWTPGSLFRGEFMQLVVQNLRWLAERQNADGGWADAEGGRSNLAATLLVESAFQLTGVPASSAGLMDQAAAYVKQAGGVAAFRSQYKDDEALSASVLVSCALADLAPWRRVPHLSWGRITSLFQRNNVGKSSPDDPTAPLLAAGVAKYRHAPPWNPVRRLALRAVQGTALATLEGLQGVSGGFRESIPQTSFVVMSLAGAGLQDHAVVRRGVEFLLSTVHAEGGWPSRRAAA
jgi:squalene-hopene/tetraprenyl-beta-curcumene cyclase